MCGLLLDVTGEVLFTLVKCPRCHCEVRVRTRYGPYELLGILGQGGSGRVFRGHRLTGSEGSDSEAVALKILEKTHADYEEQLLLFRNEARFAALIQHPRVVRVIALEEDEHGVRLVMEVMEGGSLHDQIESKEKPSERRILETGLEILKALSTAYSKGIIHRDLKPANILYNASGGAKLGDFGLARNLSSPEENALPLEVHLMATPDYVAPEILAGETGDFRSDLYGLGGSLYHALCGKPPYATEGKSLEKLRQIKTHPVRISCKKQHLLPETAALVNRMLEPQPEDRFASYEELEAAFLWALDQLELSKKKPVRSVNPFTWITSFLKRDGKSVSVRS
jgi:eukaryotic-like serine/threonine-protein kinase